MIIREYGNNNSRKLLFFQSTGEPWWAFKESVELLAQNYHVFQVAPDGHDPEEKSDFVSIEKTVADVTAWLKEKRVNCLDAVYGLSMGGGCAMRLIAERKIRVDKAIVDGGTAPYLYPKWICKLICVKDFLMVKLAYSNRKIMEAAFPPERFTQKGHDPIKEYGELMKYLKTYSNKTIWNVFWSANNYVMPEPASVVSTKMVFWYGEDEAHSRARDLEWAKAYFPDMAVKMIPKMEHGEFVLIYPEAFCQTAMEFLQ